MQHFPSIAHLPLNSKRSFKGKNHKWIVQEKIDGSQLSFRVVETTVSTAFDSSAGRREIESRGDEVFRELDSSAGRRIEFHNKKKRVDGSAGTVFGRAVKMLSALIDRFDPKLVYHGEAVCKPRHNVVDYSRTPRRYFILYDVYDTEIKSYVDLERLSSEAERVGLEVVQTLYVNSDPELEPYGVCSDLLKKIESREIESCLGGELEGIVLKHNSYIEEKRPAPPGVIQDHAEKIVAVKLKLVTKKFQEQHQLKKEKFLGQTPDQVIDGIAASFVTEARFRKAWQHLEEQGRPLDEYTFVSELRSDLEKEYEAEIKEYLWYAFNQRIKERSEVPALVWFRDRKETTEAKARASATLDAVAETD